MNFYSVTMSDKNREEIGSVLIEAPSEDEARKGFLNSPEIGIPVETMFFSIDECHVEPGSDDEQMVAIRYQTS